MLLLVLIIFGVGILRTYFTTEKTRKILEGKSLFTGNILASLLGIITPFCSCIYLSAFTTAKIPMHTFEIGFLGLKFSLLRILITIPVFIVIGIIMGKYFKRNNCKINEL